MKMLLLTVNTPRRAIPSCRKPQSKPALIIPCRKEIGRWWTLLLPVRDSRKMPILQQVRSKDGEANTARWKCVHAFIVFFPLNFPTTRNKDAIPQLNPEGFLNLLLFPHTLIFNTHFHLRAMLSILVYVQMFLKQDSALKKMMKKNSSPYLQGFCLGLGSYDFL